MGFVYYNINPYGLREEDCVCRAITLACELTLGLDYEDIQNKLYYTSQLLECEELCVCCYKFLLDKVFEFPRIDCGGSTVGEFAEKNPKGIFIVRMAGHLSIIVRGNVHDIWNCSDRVITHCWQVE